MAPLSSADKYRNTPRKVFDKSMDRMELRIQRIKEDYRADLVAIMARIVRLEESFVLLDDKITDLFPIETELPPTRKLRR